MENNGNENVGFTYTYSAKEQAEIKRIRDKYTQPTAEESVDKMTELRRLDAGVTKTAEAVSLSVGIVGTLLLGFGMSLCMTDIGNVFSTQAAAMATGISVGILGGVIAAFAYPVHNAVIKFKRKRLAPRILKLTDELMK